MKNSTLEAMRRQFRHNIKSANRSWGWLKWVGGLTVALVVAAAGVAAVNWPGRQWAYGERLTVLEIETDGVWLASVDPEQKAGVRLELPPDLEIETRGGRGKFKVGVFTQLLQREPSDWLAGSVSDYLGVAVVGVKDKLNLIDRINWEWWSRQAVFRKVSLSESLLVSSGQAVDGVKVVDLSAHWRDAQGDWFVSKKIAEQGLNVTVINTTATPGLGARATRIIESMGIKVGMVKNDDKKLEKCELESAEPARSSPAVEWLIKQFGCDWVLGEAGETEVVVRLGNRYRQLIYGG